MGLENAHFVPTGAYATMRFSNIFAGKGYATFSAFGTDMDSFMAVYRFLIFALTSFASRSLHSSNIIMFHYNVHFKQTFLLLKNLSGSTLERECSPCWERYYSFTFFDFVRLSRTSFKKQRLCSFLRVCQSDTMKLRRSAFLSLGTRRGFILVDKYFMVHCHKPENCAIQFTISTWVWYVESGDNDYTFVANNTNILQVVLYALLWGL